MSLNLGLQSIGLMRAEMGKQNERLMKASMKDVRSQAEGNQSFKGDYLDSMAPVKALLSTLFQRLKLKVCKTQPQTLILKSISATLHLLIRQSLPKT